MPRGRRRSSTWCSVRVKVTITDQSFSESDNEPCGCSCVGSSFILQPLALEPSVGLGRTSVRTGLRTSMPSQPSQHRGTRTGALSSARHGRHRPPASESAPEWPSTHRPNRARATATAYAAHAGHAAHPSHAARLFDMGRGDSRLEGGRWRVWPLRWQLVARHPIQHDAVVS